MIVGVVAAKHAGATTTAVALATAGVDTAHSLVVEADSAGGDLAASTGLSVDPGLLTLAATGRHALAVSSVAAHSQELNSKVNVLLAPMSRVQSVNALNEIASRLAPVLSAVDDLVVVDAGRWDPSSPQRSLLARADVILVVIRPTVAGVEHLRVRMAELHDIGSRVAVVTLGERPYRTDEIAEATGVEVAGALAWDPRGAHAVMTGASARSLRRTPLIRSARSILDRLPDTAALVDADR